MWKRLDRTVAVLCAIGVLVIAAFVLMFIEAPWWMDAARLHTLGELDIAAQHNALDEDRSQILKIAAGLGAAVALIHTARKHSLDRHAHALNEQSQITDRYIKAAEQLGSASVDVRLGGIYALGRIMLDSAADRRTVAEVLAAYVRHHSPTPNHDGTIPVSRQDGRLGVDIGATLIVLARNAAMDHRVVLDLRFTNLSGIEVVTGHGLANANIACSNLCRVNWVELSLAHTNLCGMGRQLELGRPATTATYAESGRRCRLVSTPVPDPRGEPPTPGTDVGMSTGIDAGTVLPPEAVVVFEPRVDRPAADDRWIAPLIRAYSRGTRLFTLRSLPLLALCVGALVVGRERLGIALPAVLAVFCASQFAAGVRAWYRSGPRSRERLLATPLRRISLAEGDLLATSRSVYLRLSGDRWFRIRPASVYVPLLARRRYVSALGPDSAGRAIVFVPGMVRDKARRVGKAPSTKARQVAPVTVRTVAPKDDPVARATARLNWHGALSNAVPNLLLAAWLAAAYVPPLFAVYRTPDDLFGAATAFGLALALYLLLRAVVPVFRWRSFLRVTQAAAWTPLRFTFDSPPRRGAAFQKVTGHASLPDGVVHRVESRSMNVNLAAATLVSGVLWVAGTPTKGRNVVGVPGYPQLGLAKLGPARQAD